MSERRGRLGANELSKVLFAKLLRALREDDEDAFRRVVAEAEAARGAIDRRILLNERDLGASALHVAVNYSSLPLIAQLTARILALKGNVDAKDVESGWTPLHLACFLRKPLVALHLIHCGACMYIRDRDDNFPIDFLVQSQPKRREEHVAEAGGDVYVHGSNASFQLGAADNKVDFKMHQISVEGLENVKMVATGKQHSLFLGLEGGVWAVGLGEGGRLGMGDDKSRAEAAKIRDLPQNIEYVACSRARSAAISDLGVLYIWGNNVLKPTRFLKGVQVKQVALADDYVLAVDEAGQLWAWGDNRDGQLALSGVVEHQPTPRQIFAFDGLRVARAYVGEGNLSSVIMTTGEVFTFGGGKFLPRRVTLLFWPSKLALHRSEVTTAKSLASCGETMFALSTAGQVYSWKAGESCATLCSAFGRRRMSQIAACGSRVICVDTYGSAHQYRLSQRTRGSFPLEGCRGIASVAAWKEHAVFITTAMPSSDLDIVYETLAQEAYDGVPSLTLLAAGCISELLDLDNVLYMLDLAVKIDCGYLFKSCVQLIAPNLDTILCNHRYSQTAPPLRAMQAIDAYFGRPKHKPLSCDDVPRTELDISKRCRTVRKKLQGIERLEKRQARGEKLSPEEALKLRQKDVLLDELKLYVELGISAAGSPSPSPHINPVDLRASLDSLAGEIGDNSNEGAPRAQTPATADVSSRPGPSERATYGQPDTASFVQANEVDQGTSGPTREGNAVARPVPVEAKEVAATSVPSLGASSRRSSRRKKQRQQAAQNVPLQMVNLPSVPDLQLPSPLRSNSTKSWATAPVHGDSGSSLDGSWPLVNDSAQPSRAAPLQASLSAGLPGAGPSSAGPPSAGPSSAEPSDAGPSGAGPSGAGPSGAGPSGAGPSGVGPSSAGPSSARRSNTRPSSASRPPSAQLLSLGSPSEDGNSKERTAQVNPRGQPLEKQVQQADRRLQQTGTLAAGVNSGSGPARELVLAPTITADVGGAPREVPENTTKSKRNKSRTLFQIGGLPMQQRTAKRTDVVVEDVGPVAASPPKMPAWQSAPAESNGVSSSHSPPKTSFLAIQNEELERQKRVRNSTSARSAHAESTPSRRPSKAKAENQAASKKQWTSTAARQAAPSLADIQREEERKALVHRSSSRSCATEKSAWMRLPSDEPARVKSLKSIEVEERAIKAIRAQTKDAIVRRVAS